MKIKMENAKKLWKRRFPRKRKGIKHLAVKIQESNRIINQKDKKNEENKLEGVKAHNRFLLC